MMQASIYKKYGTPKVLTIKEMPKPIPQAKEVLVKVKAATVNRTDCAMLLAKPFFMRFLTGLFTPKNPILGTDFAGEIEAIGSEVSNFKVGDRVFGFNDEGLSSHATYLTITAQKPMVIIPEHINFQQAAASIEGFHYAYNTLNKVTLRKGQKVLINGATGAIGNACLQLAVQAGAEVTAVGNTQNQALLKSLGAIQTIDYTQEDFTQTCQEQFDYIFDAVGKSSFRKCKPLLTPKGVYISSELGWMAENLFYSCWTPIFRKKRVVFPFPSNIQASLNLVKKMIEAGQFQPIIDKKYPLHQIATAFEYVLTGQKTGNVVITMD